MKFQRSTYLINPRFQLRISFFLSSLVFILSLAYPLTIYSLFETMVVQSNLQETTDAFADNKYKIISTLALYQLGFIFIIFIICMFQAHKIAGPMYKLHHYLKNVAEGGKIEKIFFRKDDHFLEIAEDLNQALFYLKNNYNKDYAYVSEITSYLKNISGTLPEDKKAVVDKIIHQLEEIQSRFVSL